MGAYGNFLVAFPELTRRIKFIDGRIVRGILVHTARADAVREITDFNNAGDLSYLYVSTRAARTLKLGDRFTHPEFGYEMRVTGLVPYNLPAGYTQFKVERVTTPDSTQTQSLGVKEARFD